MDIEKAAFGVIEHIYDAALAPEKWQQVMTNVVEILDTNSALLREVNYTKGKVGFYKTVGFDPTYTKAYREHYVHLDFFAPAMMREPIGTVSRGDQAVPWEQQRNTEFCNDYLLAQNNRYCVGITLAKEKDYHLLFALQRGKRPGDFSDQHLLFLRTLAPHMMRAFSVHRQMFTITKDHQWACSALDRLKVGVIFLDERGKPGFINHKANTLISSGYGLAINRNSLQLATVAESARLEYLITNATKAASGVISGAGGSMRTTSSPEKTLHIQVIPLPRDKSERPWGTDLSGSCVAVFLSASGPVRLRIDVLSSLYGLTPAEAKLTSLLADGLTLECAADKLDVSVQTVRSQLKAIFAKTGVSRQAELVALVLTDILSHHLID